MTSAAKDTVNLTIRMDRELKQQMEEVLDAIGLSTTAAFTVFAKKVVGERAIPFKVAAPDPFYSESNLRALEESMRQHKEGKVVVKTLEELRAME